MSRWINEWYVNYELPLISSGEENNLPIKPPASKFHHDLSHPISAYVNMETRKYLKQLIAANTRNVCSMIRRYKSFERCCNQALLKV